MSRLFVDETKEPDQTEDDFSQHSEDFEISLVW